jgi:predicted esterase
MMFARLLRRVALVPAVVGVLLAGVFVNGAAAGTQASATSHAATRVPRVDANVKRSLAGDTRGRYDSTPIKLHAEGGDLLAFPPSKSTSAQRAPMSVVYLHGVRGRVENGCPWFRSGASELGWLVCPEAIEPQPGGTWSWGADVFKQAPVVARALHAAQEQGASSEPGVAVGFSQGSYVALDLVKAHLAKFRGLVLLGAELHPNAKTLRDAGVVRIALGAGQQDSIAHASLIEEAKRLDGAGIETCFFDLGHVGHTYAVEDTTVLRDAIAWAGGLDR